MGTNASKKIIRVVLLLLSTTLFSAQADAACDEPISLYELSNLVDDVRSTYFKHIARHNITMESFNSSEAFFQTQPVVGTLLGNVYFRKYKLQYNPRIFFCPPSRKAIHAILVHEFEHINDYYESSAVELLGFATRYKVFSKFRKNYERETDKKACAKGQAEGLIEYREWIYDKLTPKQLESKKAQYLTPEELRKYL